jgi:zinc protease
MKNPLNIQLLFLVLSFMLTASLRAQVKGNDNRKPVDNIPVDPMLRMGKLDNGFTYYIRKNQEPQQRVFLRFVVKVGHIHEDADQKELAHVLEHMPFIGTAHFPAPRDYFKKNSVTKQGQTQGNRTTYSLSFASGKDELILDGLTFFRDIAGELVLDPVKINEERQVVYEEHRSLAENDIHAKYKRKVLGDSLYLLFEAKRQNIIHFKHESLFRFYNDWYRPDLEAVIIVGDIDPERIEQQIKSMFSNLKRPADPRKLKEEEIPPLKNQNRAVILTGEKQNETEVRISMLQTPLDEDLKTLAIHDLYEEMIRKRLHAQVQQYDAPFITAANSFENSSNLFTTVQLKPASIKRGMQTAIMELERVKRYGFTEKELEMARVTMKDRYVLPDQLESEKIIEEYEDHFVKGDIPNIEFKKKVKNQWFMNVTVNDINKTVGNWVTYSNMNIGMFAPEKIKDLLPDEQTLLAWIDEARLSDIAPYKDKPARIFMSANELASIKGPSKFERSEVKEIGVTRIKFPNGLQVLLKPVGSDAGNGNISIEGFSKGGTSLFKGDDFLNANYAVNVITGSGLSTLDQFELKELMALKNIDIYTYIEERDQGIMTFSSTAELETVLFIINRYFTKPNKVRKAFENIMALSKDDLTRIQDHDIQRAIAFAVDSARLRETTFAPSDLDKITLDKVYKIFRQLFSNASNYTFVLSGDFDVDKVTPLVAKYLGSIPGVKEKTDLYQHTATKLQGKINKTIYRDIKEGANVNLKLKGFYEVNAINNFRLDILQATLQELIFWRLREKERGVYQVVVLHKKSQLQDGMYEFSIAFNCADPNTRKLIAATLDEIALLKNKGINADAFQRVLAFKTSAQKDDLKSRQFWTGYLKEQIQHARPLSEIAMYDSLLNSLTPKSIQEIAQKYLKEDNLLQVVLLPESYRSKEKESGKLWRKAGRWLSSVAHGHEPRNSSNNSMKILTGL